LYHLFFFAGFLIKYLRDEMLLSSYRVLSRSNCVYTFIWYGHSLCCFKTNRIINSNFSTMTELNIQENKKVPAWFWITLFLLIVGSIIAYIIFLNDGRTDQINRKKKTTFLQHKSNYAICNNGRLESLF
jgi:hypothetical protein